MMQDYSKNAKDLLVLQKQPDKNTKEASLQPPSTSSYTLSSQQPERELFQSAIISQEAGSDATSKTICLFSSYHIATLYISVRVQQLI